MHLYFHLQLSLLDWVNGSKTAPLTEWVGVNTIDSRVVEQYMVVGIIRNLLINLRHLPLNITCVKIHIGARSRSPHTSLLHSPSIVRLDDRVYHAFWRRLGAAVNSKHSSRRYEWNGDCACLDVIIVCSSVTDLWGLPAPCYSGWDWKLFSRLSTALCI